MAILNLSEYLPRDELPVCTKRFDIRKFYEHLLCCGNAFTENVDPAKCTGYKRSKHKKDVDVVYGTLIDPMHVTIHPETKEFEVR